ncbi:unnamed protein product, partial [Timema podura]|nr:unnamed protein product [Timema podura]
GLALGNLRFGVSCRVSSIPTGPWDVASYTELTSVIAFYFRYYNVLRCLVETKPRLTCWRCVRDGWRQTTPADGEETTPVSGRLHFVFAWSAPALPYLQSALASDDTTTQPGGNYTYYNVSEDLSQRRVNFYNNASTGLPPDDTISVAEGSIISSLVAIGCLVGSLPAGQLANAFGRRTMLQVMNVPLLVGWIIIIFADRHVSSTMLD